MKFKQLKIKKLINSGIHLGNQPNLLNPNFNKSYLLGSRNNLYIFNLNKTLTTFKKFILLLNNKRVNSNILFIGSKYDSNNIIKKTALKCNQYYLDYSWIGGQLTNTNQMNSYSNIKFDFAIIFDINNSSFAINELKKLNIPIIAFSDSNNDLRNISYPIIGNIQSTEAISFYCKLIENIFISKKKNNNIKFFKNFINSYKIIKKKNNKIKKNIKKINLYKFIIILKKKNIHIKSN